MRAKSGALAFVFCALMLGACTSDSSSDASITITNVSSYDIYELYITPTGDPNWGPDLLGGDFLGYNEYITIEVTCDYYDILLVDDLGAECEVDYVDLCGTDDEWVIDDVELANCTF